MSTLLKFIRGATFLAVASLIVGFCVAETANAGYTALPVTITASTTNSDIFTLSINEEAVRTQSASTRVMTGYTTVSSYSLNATSVSYGCGGGVSGSGFSSSGAAPTTPFLTTKVLDISKTFVVDPAGGTDTADCNESGTYYIVVSTGSTVAERADCTTKQCFYVPIQYNADTGEVTTQSAYNPGEYTNTRLTNVSRSAVSRSATTGVVTFNVGYYIDTTEWTYTYERPETILVNISDSSVTQADSIAKYILPLSTGFATSTLVSATLADGTYTAQINFWNKEAETPVFNSSYITLNFTLSGGVITSSSVVDSQLAIYPSQNAQQPCSVTRIDGCITNAFSYLFVPSQPALDIYNSALEELPSRFPFSYFYAVVDSLQGLSTISSSTAPVQFSIDLTDSVVVGQSIDILSTSTVDRYLGTTAREIFRTIMSYMIWILFATLIFFKVRVLFNP